MGKKDSIGIIVFVIVGGALLLFVLWKPSKMRVSSAKSIGQKRQELKKRLVKNPVTILFESQDWDAIGKKLDVSVPEKEQLDFLRRLQILVDTKVILQVESDRGAMFDILSAVLSRDYEKANLGASIKNFSTRVITNMGFPLPQKQFETLKSWLEKEKSEFSKFRTAYQALAVLRPVSNAWVNTVSAKLNSKDPQVYRTALSLVERMLDFKAQHQILEGLSKRYVKVPQGQVAVTIRILFQKGFFDKNIMDYAFAKKGLEWDEAVLPVYLHDPQPAIDRKILLARLENFQNKTLRDRASQSLSQNSLKVGDQ